MSLARWAAFVLIVTALVSATLSSQAQTGYPRLPAPPVKSPPDTTAPDIPGVVRGGTKVQLLRDLFRSTEDPIAMPDGSLLFTEQDAGNGQLVRIDKDDKISTSSFQQRQHLGHSFIAAASLLPGFATVNGETPRGEELRHGSGERKAREDFNVQELTHRIQLEKDLFTFVGQLHVDSTENKSQLIV